MPTDQSITSTKTPGISYRIGSAVDLDLSIEKKSLPINIGNTIKILLLALMTDLVTLECMETIITTNPSA